MAPLNLYSICVKKTCDLLISEVWEKFEENPFSTLPCSIVQDLLTFILRDYRLSRTSFAHSRLLLSSNRLENVNLLHAEYIEDYVLLFRLLSSGCRNLRTLSLPDYRYKKYIRTGSDEAQAFRKLLQNCGKLEELHSNIYFDPDDLEKCRNLRSLKLHFEVSTLADFCRCVTSNILQRLQSLEEFSFCCPSQDRTYTNRSILTSTGTVLENCPKLTTLGFFDSSTAVKKLIRKDQGITLGTPCQFQLRKCYWAAGKGLSQSVYSDMIRLAALSFPLVEVLVMDVHHADSIQHLKILRHLNFLQIDFNDCTNEYKLEFNSLLKEIGSQLQFLSVTASPEERLDVNVIINNCPNLKTLRLWCGITADEAVRPLVNLQKLERLKVLDCDRQVLFILLSLSVNLKLLYLEHCESLDDGLLRTIHKINCFPKLEEALISRCSLSTGLATFVKTAKKLTRFSSLLLNDPEMLQSVRDLKADVVCYPLNDFFASDDFAHTCWL